MNGGRALGRQAVFVAGVAPWHGGGRTANEWEKNWPSGRRRGVLAVDGATRRRSDGASVVAAWERGWQQQARKQRADVADSTARKDDRRGGAAKRR